MIIIATVLSVLLAATFGFLALRQQPASGAAARVDAFREELAGKHPGPGASNQTSPSIARAGVGAAGALATHLPGSASGWIGSSLTAAGHPITLPGFVLFSIVFAVLGGVFALAVMLTRSGSDVLMIVVVTLAGALIGLILPSYWLRRKVAARRHQIWLALPDTADLLTTCVESGLGVDAALARVALEMEGPLQVELNAGLQEISLGRGRADALIAIGARVGVSDLTGMLTAIVESEEMGTSLGRVLRAQSQHIRARRRLYAEERARKVPAKMTFPIIFLIVPTLFILILSPLGAQMMFLFS